MLYQRTVEKGEIKAANLELVLQHSAWAHFFAQLLGVCVACFLLWQNISTDMLLGVAAGFAAFLALAAFRLRSSLKLHRHVHHTARVDFELIVIMGLSGLFWSVTFLLLEAQLPDALFYPILASVFFTSVITVVVNMVRQTAVLVFIAAALLPILAVLGYQYDQRPYNLYALVFMSAGSVVLVLACLWIGRAFEGMLMTNLERGAMTQDFAKLTESLRMRNAELQNARKQLSDIATVDDLTGLKNRRAVNRVLEDELSRAKRSGMPVALVMIDVDHFKLYNDSYGHPAGDAVLQKLSAVLSSVTSRAGEMAARLGGEEFLVILPGSTQNDALTNAETIRTRINALKIGHRESPTASHVTVSQGVVVCVPALDTTPADLLEAADQALYDSKKRGRNMITLSSFHPS